MTADRIYLPETNCTRYRKSVYTDRTNRHLEQFLHGLVICGLAALLVVPYIRDFGPHSVDDPTMLLFILLLLGVKLLGIHFMRVPIRQADTSNR